MSWDDLDITCAAGGVDGDVVDDIKDQFMMVGAPPLPPPPAYVGQWVNGFATRGATRTRSHTHTCAFGEAHKLVTSY